MEPGHHHPAINILTSVILFIIGHLVHFYKANIDGFELVGWIVQNLAWLGAFLAGMSAFIGLLHKNGWINFKKKKK